MFLDQCITGPHDCGKNDRRRTDQISLRSQRRSFELIAEKQGQPAGNDRQTAPLPELVKKRIRVINKSVALEFNKTAIDSSFIVM